MKLYKLMSLYDLGGWFDPDREAKMCVGRGSSSAALYCPLSKAPETPSCSPGAALRLPPAPGMPCTHVCRPLTRSLLCMGSWEFPPKKGQ